MNIKRLHPFSIGNDQKSNNAFEKRLSMENVCIWDSIRTIQTQL